jgi:hypothetical protein
MEYLKISALVERIFDCHIYDTPKLLWEYHNHAYWYSWNNCGGW